MGGIAALPWGFTVGGSGSLRWTDYEGDWFPFTPAGQPRSDLVRSLRVFAHNRAVIVAGFSPQISQPTRCSTVSCLWASCSFGTGSTC